MDAGCGFRLPPPAGLLSVRRRGPRGRALIIDATGRHPDVDARQVREGQLALSVAVPALLGRLFPLCSRLRACSAQAVGRHSGHIQQEVATLTRSSLCQSRLQVVRARHGARTMPQCAQADEALHQGYVIEAATAVPGGRRLSAPAACPWCPASLLPPSAAPPPP